MAVWEVILIGIALSMDAFAVSVADGMMLPMLRKRYAFIIALTFGVFQAAMPMAGYALVSLCGHLGGRVSDALQKYDHWAAMIILCLLGAKMIVEETNVITCRFAFTRHGNDKTASHTSLTLFIQGIATSIDALAVGISLYAAGGGIVYSALIIGSTTTLICLPAVYLGKYTQNMLGKRANIAGGIVLILIGIKMGVIRH